MPDQMLDSPIGEQQDPGRSGGRSEYVLLYIMNQDIVSRFRVGDVVLYMPTDEEGVVTHLTPGYVHACRRACDPAKLLLMKAKPWRDAFQTCVDTNW